MFSERSTPICAPGRSMPIECVDVDDRLGERLRSFLRQVVPNSTADKAVCISAREFPAICRVRWMRCTIGIAFKGNRWHSDDRRFGEPLFEVVVSLLAFGQSHAPAVVMDHDGYVVRVIIGRGAAIEGSSVEVPLWRSELPNEFVEIARVLAVALFPALGGEIKLVPPFELGHWGQGDFVGSRATDQIATYGDNPLAAFRPEYCHDVGCARSPIKARDNCLVDLERIHQIDDVEGNHRLLSVPECVPGKE